MNFDYEHKWKVNLPYELVPYANRGTLKEVKGRFYHYHNIPNPTPKGAADALNTNYQLFHKKHEHYNVLLHFFLSFESVDRPYLKQHPEVYEEVSKKFIELLDPKGIYFITHHDNTKNDHLHLVIGANQLASSKQISLSNADMERITLALDRFQKERFPLLQTKTVYLDKEQRKMRDFEKEDQNRRKQNYYRLKQRNTNKPTNKEKLFEIVRACYMDASSLQDFHDRLLQQPKVQLCYRQRSGQITGVSFQGRKYRFDKVGIQQEHIQALENLRVHNVEEREKAILRKIQQNKSKDKEQNRER